jgi:putative ABC transport system permease protein
MDTLFKDIRYGLRSLAKRPGFTAIAVLTLALGIGASTAIFSVVDAVLLRPLPYPHAEQIVQLREVGSKGGQMRFTEPNYLDLRARNHSFDAMAQYAGNLTIVTGGTEPVRAQSFVVSGEFFEVLGVKPILGRTFAPEESKPGGAPVAIVSHGFWQRLLGGQSDLSGTSLRLMDQNVNVIGVMPVGFVFPQNAEIWIPRELFSADTSRTAHNWSVIARVRPNVTIEQAHAEVSEIGKQLKREYGAAMDAIDFAAVPQLEFTVGKVRRVLLMIFVAVGFLLLIACANVANLLLAQVTTRQRDFAVRSAVGATRFRLARQFITENVLLVLAAGTAGILISFWVIELLTGLNRQNLPRSGEIVVDARAIAFTFGLSLLIGIVLGIVPLLRYSTEDLESTLRETTASARGYAGKHLRGFLVVTQMALTLMLLVGAGLLGKSFYRLLQIDPGFQTESAVAMELSQPEAPPVESRYRKFMESYDRLMKDGKLTDDRLEFSAEEQRQILFHKQLLERLSTSPGVVSVGTINHLPLTGGGPDGMFLINNNPERKGYGDFRLASAGYFSAMGIPVLRGRTFGVSDPNAPNEAVISQSLARKYWSNEDPIGQTIQFGNMDGDLRLLHVVGVVGDVHDYGVDEAMAPTVYANALQRIPASTWTVVARAKGEPATLVPMMREAVRALNSELPLKFHTLDQVFSSSLDQRRFSMVIFGVFGVAALLLATMGIYGVTTYTVAQRTHEIGIRMALGAQMDDVLKLVLRNAMSLVAIGAIVGLAGAYAITRVMSHLLFEVAPTDLFTFMAVPLVLLVVALVACLIPARRATKVDPLIALRYE